MKSKIPILFSINEQNKFNSEEEFLNWIKSLMKNSPSAPIESLDSEKNKFEKLISEFPPVSFVLPNNIFYEN